MVYYTHRAEAPNTKGSEDMSVNTKRRDSKNRILRDGESQRPDGRYAFKYTDASGKQHFVYSWKLVKTDKVPTGKRDCVPLRESEKKIQQDLNDGVAVNGGNKTVLQLVEQYVSQKTGVRYNTKSKYRTVTNFLKANEFGQRKISNIKLSDAKSWLIGLQKNGKSYSSIEEIKNVVKPAFRLAVDDDLIRKNPFGFPLGTVIENDSKKRIALTPSQEEQFLDFVCQDKVYRKYYDEILILFRTGIRIGEFCGLTFSDVDMSEHTISINHQLQKSLNGKRIEDTKTDSGTRILPMTDEVYECFQRILSRRRKPRLNP